MNAQLRLNQIAKAILLSMGIFTLAACQSPAVQDPAIGPIRAALTELKATPDLASRAPTAISDAEKAVQAAEVPQRDPAVASHLVYVANNKVQTATALAQARYAEDRMKALANVRDQLQLNARTQEAERAKLQADAAKRQVDVARQQTATAQQQAMESEAKASSLEQQLSELKSKQTERGLVVTLGDTLFEFGKSELKAGAQVNLDRLAEILKKESKGQIVIEGHTDSVGSNAYNQALSQRRAAAVREYLLGKGVPAHQVSALGKGEDFPVASNSNSAGRQQNRRVEVIVETEATAAGSSNR